MVMDRMMEFKNKEDKNKDKILTLMKRIMDNGNNILSFCKRSTKITYFKITFSYEIQSQNNGAILYDKTWEEGKK